MILAFPFPQGPLLHLNGSSCVVICRLPPKGSAEHVLFLGFMRETRIRGDTYIGWRIYFWEVCGSVTPLQFLPPTSNHNNGAFLFRLHESSGKGNGVRCRLEKQPRGASELSCRFRPFSVEPQGSRGHGWWTQQIAPRPPNGCL